MHSQEGYDAIRHGVALVQRTDRGVIQVLGADAASWLQGLLTNDIEALSGGHACYAAYLTPQGRMITDVRVVRLADRILLDVPESLAAALATRLDALIFAEDVQIEDVSSAIVALELHGPQAPPAIDGLGRDAGAKAVAIARDDQYGVPGYVIYVKADERPALESRILDAGAVRVDRETLDVVRVEAGRPAFLIDMETDTIPLEAGIEDRAISFTKGCYVGQEIIVRVTQRGGGRVARKLVGLTIDEAPTPPAHGSTIRSGVRDIGRITSAVFSPTLDRVIALGYVHRDFVEPGTPVTVVSGNAEHAARVTPTPFTGRG